MSLQVCNAPGCKRTTLLEYCDDHVDELVDDFEDEVSAQWTTLSSQAMQRRKDREPRATEDAAALMAAIDRIGKEAPMKGQECTKCKRDVAADSVQCEHHRDLQRAANARYQGRPAETPARKYTPRTATKQEQVQTMVKIIPNLVRAPITLAEPTVVNGEHGLDIDVHIGQLESDLAMLRGAKAIMEGYRA